MTAPPARPPGHPLGQIPGPVAAAIGFPETIRLRREITAVVLLRVAQEEAFARYTPVGQHRAKDIAFDELSVAVDALLVRLGEAGLLR